MGYALRHCRNGACDPPSVVGPHGRSHEAMMGNLDRGPTASVFPVARPLARPDGDRQNAFAGLSDRLSGGSGIGPPEAVPF